MHSLRRLALCGLVLLALTATACGDDDDDVASAGDDSTDTTEAADDGPTAEAGAAAVEFFQSTEQACADHAAESGNDVIDPRLFAEATWDEPMSNELGAIIVTDGDGTALNVNVDEGTISGTEGPMGPIPVPYAFSCPEDVYVGTMDDGGAVAFDPCPIWSTWLSSGDDQTLADLESALHDSPDAGEILDAIAFLQSDPATDTADQQAAYEGAVDTITADLSQAPFACSFD